MSMDIVEAVSQSLKAVLLPELKELQAGHRALQDGQQAIIARLDAFETRTNQRFEQAKQQFEQEQKLSAQRFEQVEKRFEQVDRQFEEVNRKFEEVRRQFDQAEKVAELRFKESERQFNAAEQLAQDRFSFLSKQIELLSARVAEQNVRLQTAEAHLLEVHRDMTKTSGGLATAMTFLQEVVLPQKHEARIRKLEDKLRGLEGAGPKKKSGTG